MPETVCSARDPTLRQSARWCSCSRRIDGHLLDRIQRRLCREIGAFGPSRRVLRRNAEWSLAVLVPANTLAINVFDYMAQAVHGLPAYPIDILVAAEGPMLAADLIALLVEPRSSDQHLAAAILDGLAAFELGRSEEASMGAPKAVPMRTSCSTRLPSCALKSRTSFGSSMSASAIRSRAQAIF